MKKTTNKSNTKFKKINLEFSDNNLTNYSGIIPFFKFLVGKLNFVDFTNKILDIRNGSNVKYKNHQVLLSIIFGYICDFTRLSHFEEFTKDKIIQEILNINKHIDENTFANRLKKFNFKSACQISEITKEQASIVHSKMKYDENKLEIVDLDSTVKGVYGNQPGAAKGFNPKKHGQKSYHPLLAFLVSSKECVHSWFRPGDTYTGNGVEEFIKECHERLPQKHNNYLYRADSGFFSESFIGEVERKNSKFLVKVKLKNLKPLLEKQEWQSLPGIAHTEYSEFYHQCNNWTKSRKFVGIRILKETITEGVLFTQKIYDYLCFATNLEEAPIEIFHLYKDRGECENWIEAVKNQLGAGTTLTDHFWANDVLWQLAVFAYNLTIWIRKLTCEKSWRQEPKTFRNWFVRTAGKLVKHARKITLKLQKNYYYEKDWMRIYIRICAIQF